MAYTSLATLDIDEEQLLDIKTTARDLNALDGITGVLVYNGTHFFQWIEGPEQAIDDLLLRLRRDERHNGVEIRFEGDAQTRLFSQWAMQLLHVPSQRLQSRADLMQSLPADLPATARERILGMVEAISAEVTR